MTCVITKDPDNEWYVYIDWIDWFVDQRDNIAGEFFLTGSAWFPDPAISEDASSFSNETKKTYFSGSGGVAGNKYNLVNRITYTVSTTSGTYTEDRTIEVRIKEK